MREKRELLALDKSAFWALKMSELIESRTPVPDFRVLFESAPGLFLVLDPDFRILAASDAYLRATMTSRESIVGRGMFEVFPDNPDDASSSGARNLRASLDLVRCKLVADTMSVQKYDIRRPDAEGGGFEERFWSPMNSPVLDQAGKLSYIIHRVENVSEFIRMKRLSGEQRELSIELRNHIERIEADIYERAQEVAKANRELQRANVEINRLYEQTKQLDRAKTAFFSNISHEFRTPLTLMLGPLEDSLTETDEPLTPRQQERQELIHRNGLRLLRLVNTLLDFSRLEAGRAQAFYEPIDLSIFTSELVNTFQPAINRAGIRLIVDCPPLAAPAYVDRDMWEKIVLNLLSNAFKHTFTGWISVSQLAVGNIIKLRVRDTGVGIPADQLPRLFERFHRVQGAKSRTHEGSGIGLALVQDLAKLHGGTVQVESEVDRGSAFTVNVPFGKDHLPHERIGAAKRLSASLGSNLFVEEALQWLPDAGRPIAKDRADAITAPPSAPRVLLADDNADMRDYVRQLLGRRWRVEAVADGAAALATARVHPPDLILSDVMMPHLDGLGLLRALRAEPQLRHVPVILLSARAGEEAGIEGLEAGADDYLTKPFSAQELIARVGAHLEMSRLRRHASEALRASEERYRGIVEGSVGGIAETDGSGRFLTVNDRYCTIVGYSREELLELRMQQITHPEDLPRNLDHLTSLAGEGRPFEIEKRYIRKDGSIVWVHNSVSGVRDPQGKLQSLIAVAVDITDRRSAEAALRHRTEQFETVINQAPLGIYIVDADNRVVLANPVVMAAWDHRPGIIGGDFPEIICHIWGQQYGNAILAIFLHILQTGEPHVTPELVATRADRGVTEYYYWRADRITLPDGRFAVLCYFQDISAQVLPRLKLAESEERFRSTFEQAAVGVAHVAVDGRWLRVNRHLCDILGYSRQELLLLSFQVITYADDLDAELAQVELLLAGRIGRYDVDKRYIKKDGDIVWVHLTVSLVRQDDVTPDYFISVVEDIDARKRTEQALQEREKRYHLVMRATNDAVWDWNLTTDHVEWNQSLGDRFGHAMKAVQPIGAWWIEHIHPDDRQRVSNSIHAVIDVAGDHWTDEYRRADGSFAHVLDRGYVLRDDCGKAVRMIGSMLDLSNQKRAEEELRRANAELEHFASIASHDLQEPLRMISSYCDILSRRYAGTFDAKGKEYFGRIIAGSLKMRSLINALRAYSQVDRQPIKLDDVAAREALQDALEFLQEEIAAKQAEVTIGDLPVVRVDRIRLTQLFQNLVANGLKFSVKDRAPIVRIESQDAGEEWVVQVCDNGIGISVSDQQRLFRIFQRLHPADAYPGSGIGLATCKKIVEQHGGRIWVESTPGMGSTFCFTIPKHSVVPE